MHVMCGFLIDVLRVIVSNIISRLKLIMSRQLSLELRFVHAYIGTASPLEAAFLVSHNIIIILYMYLSGTDEMHKIHYIQLLSANAT